MGIFKKNHNNYCNFPGVISAPNPSVFRIIQLTKVGEHYVSRIRYPDATNFEGLKILVTTFDPRERSVLDPHFIEGSGIVARFEPNARGWNNAIAFCRAISGKITNIID